MLKLITLGLCAIVAIASSPSTERDSADNEKLRWVRGFLDAHWEYANFVPDRGSGLKVMDFQIREEKWQRIYFAPVIEAMRLRPDETICFRVIGQGFIAPRRPSFMQPWEGNQFVFVKIKRLERIISDEKCASGSNTNGS